MADPGGLGDVELAPVDIPSPGLELAPGGLAADDTPATGGGAKHHGRILGLLPPRKLAFSPSPKKRRRKDQNLASPKSQVRAKAKAKADAKPKAKASADAKAKAKATTKAKAKAKATANAEAEASACASAPELELEEAPRGDAYSKKKAYCNERNVLLRLVKESYKPRGADAGPLTEKQKFYQSRLRELVVTRGGEAKDYFKEVSKAWRELQMKQAEAQEVVAQRDAALLARVSDGAGAVDEEPEAGAAEAEVLAPEPATSTKDSDDGPNTPLPASGSGLSSPAAVDRDAPSGGKGLSIKSQRALRRKSGGTSGVKPAKPPPRVPDQLQAPQTQGPESELQAQGAQEPLEEDSQMLTLDDI